VIDSGAGPPLAAFHLTPKNHPRVAGLWLADEDDSADAWLLADQCAGSGVERMPPGVMIKRLDA